MRERLGLDHIGLLPEGPTLSVGIGAGQRVAVMGPAASGKTRLLRVLAGVDRPAQGQVTTTGEVSWVAHGGLARRTRPMALARMATRGKSISAATEALITTRLWDRRNDFVSELSPSELAAAELLAPITGDAPILLLDGQLDQLDPWTLGSIWESLNRRVEAGACLIFATHRPDLAETCDVVIVLRQQKVRFAGSVEDLLRQGPPHVLSVETENQSGVRALVDPFAMRVETTPNGLRIEAREGQELAARLMLEGYGDVKLVVHRPPTLDEALRSLFA